MKKVICCYLIFLWAYSIIWSQELNNFTFSKITPEGGVGYSSVMCIGQDDLGFIWFGTNNGLFKYDSQMIVRYATDPVDSLSIPTNRINQFYLDKSNNFWIATENGLCKYHRKEDNFSTLKYVNKSNRSIGKNIQSFFQDKQDQFWIVDDTGVCRFDTASLCVEYVSISEKDVRINRAYSDCNQKLWFTSYRGQIYFYDDRIHEFVLFSEGLNDTPRALLVDEGNVWVGYENNGLICLRLSDGKQMYRYSNLSSQPNYISSSKIRALTKDLKGNIWVATYNGINIIKENMPTICLSDRDMYNIPHPSIWSFFNDSQNNIWVGTWLGGLCMYNEYMNTVYHYHKSPLLSKLKDDVISCFAEDNDSDKIWFGTERGGMYCLNLKNNELEYEGLVANLSDMNIKSIAVDKFKTIWVGTYGHGIWYKKTKDKYFSLFQTQHEIGWQIIDITPTDEGIWFANYSQGVLYYSFKTQKTISYKHNPIDLYSVTSDFVRNIIPDHKGNIWLATISGLNKYVPSEKKFYHYFKEEGNDNSLSNNFIYSLLEDEKGILWIGTNGNGLNRYDPVNHRFDVFTMQDGLSGNEVFAIVSDDKGLLWISTENGITSFNTTTHETRNMIIEPGICNNQFNPTAGFKSTVGELFFGGSNGFIRFSPFEIKTNLVKPNVVLSHFSIHNREIMPNDKASVLSHHISNTKEIVLRHDQNSFSLDFVANNFLYPSKNKFRYRLLGFDKEWLETDFTGKAIYTNIAPGHYVFEVIAANNDEVWNHDAKQLNIYILPPYWKRWYAIVFYLIVIVILTYLIRAEIISKEKLKNAVTIEKIHLENEKKLSQLKLQFFTNISHEFRTPLTLILGPIERLLKSHSANKNTADQLFLVRNNALRLLKLVTQIIDFRKVESGKMELELTMMNVVDFCANIYSNFKEHACHRNISYTFNSDVPQLNIQIDKDKVDKILFNLLSNAFKNTPDQGNIRIEIKKNSSVITHIKTDNKYAIGNEIKGEYFEISIQDNGCGIAQHDLARIFERFYHGKEGKYGNVGIGLSLTKELVLMMTGRLVVASEESEGTLFAVQLPVLLDKRLSSINTLFTPPSDILSDASCKRTHYDIVNLEDELKHKDALVLIVEDNVELCDFISDVLSPYFRTAKAKDGKQGIEYANTIFPDIIISDIMMPEVDGCELCRRVKNDITTSHIPVILLTALHSVQDNMTGLSVGADAYISKPFQEELLIVQIDNLIESRSRLRESFSSSNHIWEENIEGLSLDKKLIKKAIGIVTENLLEENFSVEMLASEIGLSRTHLHRKLKSITNQSASEFIRNIRLEKAKELMKCGELKINEIGFAVGFNSHTYFTKSFKKYVGLSPQDYVKENKVEQY
jgi:signal transduction histidine kinase/ligand-binding sensor domain-containing protein/DNA-binding response OmpR family regulator